VGHITFGCLNNYCKITGPTWDAWIALLLGVPDSKLLLHAYEGHHRDVARERLAAAGIEPARLDFVGFLPFPAYLRQFQQIDIALDPFPYTGGTTTCDALWMGVPVVSLAGKTAVARGGLSILSNIGRSQWVAENAEQYVRIAAELAGNLPQLAAERASLRDRMLHSSLTDAPGFARDVEEAFRKMWHSFKP
jgi:predicted O-linked N-acetylglucosamine transferase (SPINDLY family)